MIKSRNYVVGGLVIVVGGFFAGEFGLSFWQAFLLLFCGWLGGVILRGNVRLKCANIVRDEAKNWEDSPIHSTIHGLLEDLAEQVQGFSDKE